MNVVHCDSVIARGVSILYEQSRAEGIFPGKRGGKGVEGRDRGRESTEVERKRIK